MLRSRILLCFILVALYSCRQKDDRYSFFVAGHVYGSPFDTLPGLHPPFVEEFSYIKSLDLVRFGIFTGDIVFRSQEIYWDSVEGQINKLEKPVYFAAGNHDAGLRSIYSERYGPTYYRFEYQSDLFLVLNPGLSGWNITGEQLEFLKKELNASFSNSNIFIFMHQVIWWTPGGKYPELQINSQDGRAPEVNFWTEIEPLLLNTKRPVFLFAGDVGATPEKTSFFYDHYDNITLIASGMGNLIQDNYLVMEIDEKNQASLSIRWIRERKLQKITELFGK